MKLEWKNIWMHKTWQPLRATTLDAAGDELMRDYMPHAEEGTKVRDAETGTEWNWTPPRTKLHFEPGD